MITVLRACRSCGGDVDITEGNYIAMSLTHETMYFCKGCLFLNPTFKNMAMLYAKEHIEEMLKSNKNTEEA